MINPSISTATVVLVYQCAEPGLSPSRCTVKDFEEASQLNGQESLAFRTALKKKGFAEISDQEWTPYMRVEVARFEVVR